MQLKDEQETTISEKEVDFSHIKYNIENEILDGLD
jgi:hypothetical protein